jgi:meiosis induction protein kinase IME2/SME1
MIDFGTVRNIGNHKPPYTTYVSTRWYRAPEMVLRAADYGPEVDIFAAGCVFAELITGNPLFPGSSELD